MSMPIPLKRYYRLLTIGIILVSFALALNSVVRLSAAYDELIFVDIGRYLWHSGDFTIQQVHYHPPLSYYLNSAFLDTLKVPWRINVNAQGHYGFWPGRAILYHGPYSPDLPLFLARYPFVLLFILVGAVLWRWAKQLFRREDAATWSLLFFALSPTVLAHGTLATTDFVLTAMIFLTGVSLWQFLRYRRFLWLVATAFFFAGGLLSKLTGMALWGIVPVFFLVTWWAAHRGSWPQSLTWRRGVVWGLTLILLIGFFTAAGYGFHSSPAWSPATRPHRLLDKIFFFLPESGNRLLYRIAEQPIPGYDYMHMFLYQIHHQEVGHDNYLLGHRSFRGWIYYFPVAWMVKTPLVTMVTLLLALVGFWRLRQKKLAGVSHWLRAVWLGIPVAAIFIPALFVHTDIGIRYLLPFYPYFFVFLGYALYAFKRRRWRLVILGALAMGYLFTALFTTPDYISYFNLLAGGPDNGYKILADSNLDWGQSLKELKVYLDREGIDEVKLAYFGSELPEKRGIYYQPLKCTPEKGVIAISATYWQELYQDNPHCYDWLHPLPVTKQVGHTIFIYDLR